MAVTETIRVPVQADVTMDLNIVSIARLELKPGDTLVATVRRSITPDEVLQVRHLLQERVPNDVRVMVISDEVELSVVAPQISCTVAGCNCGTSTVPLHQR